jgi:hypothetical protein
MATRKPTKEEFVDYSDMSPEDVADMRAREKANKAYNQAMPDPYEEGNPKKEKRGVIDSAINAVKNVANRVTGDKSKDIRKKFIREAQMNSRQTEMPRVDEMGNAYKKGGSVSSASKRADGIAIRGKTRA